MPSFRVFSRLFAVFAISSLMASAAAARADDGILRGTVLDSSGAVVVGAVVTLHDTASHLERHTTTDERGEFAFDGVAGRRATLVGTARGFAAAALDIGGAGRQALTVTLDAAPVSELVDVRGSLPDAATVSTATRLPASPLDIPQTIDSVGAPLLRDQAVRSMQEALSNVPGVSPNLGEGRRDQFLIRGFSAQSDTLIDGVRDDALYYRDVSTLERVEVLKGPASALFGRGSSGGVINRVSKRARLDRSIGDVSVMLGGFDTRRLTFDVGRPLASARAAYRVAGAWEDSGSFRDYGSLSRIALAPSLSATLGTSTTVSVVADLLHDSRTPDRGIPSLDGRPAPVPISQYYGSPATDFITTNVAGATIAAEHQFGSGWLGRAVGRVASYATTWDNTQPLSTRLTADQIFVKRGQYNADQNQVNLFVQAEASRQITTLGLAHVVLIGTELGRQTREVLRFNGAAPDVTLFSPVLSPVIYSTVPASNTRFRGNVGAVYVQDQLAFGAHWKALLGLRGDRYAQALDDRSPKHANIARTDATLSPRAGLVYQPTSAVSLYGSVSRSFQPSGEGLSLAVNAAELGPEQTRNLEAGVKVEPFGGRLIATAAVFRLDRTNIKTTDPLDITRLVLVGRQRTDGMEAAVEGAVTRRWKLHAGYAWFDATIVRSNSVLSGVKIEGNMAGLVPRHSGTMWTTVDATSHLTVGGGVTAAGRRFTSNDDLVALPAFARTDAMVRYRIGAYELAVNVRNVFDERYYETAGGDFQIFPGAPRQAVATVRYVF